jgi:hypothetical protein
MSLEPQYPLPGSTSSIIDSETSLISIVSSRNTKTDRRLPGSENLGTTNRSIVANRN